MNDFMEIDPNTRPRFQVRPSLAGLDDIDADTISENVWKGPIGCTEPEPIVMPPAEVPLPTVVIDYVVDFPNRSMAERLKRLGSMQPTPITRPTRTNETATSTLRRFMKM